VCGGEMGVAMMGGVCGGEMGAMLVRGVCHSEAGIVGACVAAR
jgi:hypothetical protein